MSPDDDLPVPIELSDIELGELLETDAAGKLYRGHSHGRSVLIYILRPKALDRHPDLDRCFRLTFARLARTRHPRVPGVYTVGSQKQIPYAVFEDVDESDSLCALGGLLAECTREDRPSEPAALVAKLLGSADDDGYPDVESPTSDFVGRDEAIEQLAGWRDESLETGRGRLVVVQGPAGMGKTRILDAFARNTDDLDIPVLRGDCDREPDLPYGPFRRALSGYLDRLNRLSQRRRTTTIEQLRNAVAPHADCINRFAPQLVQRLGLRDEFDPSRRLGALPSRRRFIEATVDVWCRLARGYEGAILLVDDADRLGDDGRRLFDRLVSRTDAAPLLVVATETVDAAGISAFANISGDPQIDRRELTSFDLADVASFAESYLQTSQVPKELVETLVERGDGRPLHLERHLRTLIGGGALELRWGEWRFDPTREFARPAENAEDLDANRPRERHDRIADALERNDGDAPRDIVALAHHSSRGHVENNPERVYRSNRDAALAMSERMAPKRARRYASAAMTTARKHRLEVEPRLFRAYGENCAILGRTDRAVVALERAARGADDPVEEAHLHAEIAEILASTASAASRAAAHVEVGLDAVEIEVPHTNGARTFSTLFWRWRNNLASEFGLGTGDGERDAPEKVVLQARLLRRALRTHRRGRDRLSIPYLSARARNAAHQLGSSRIAVDLWVELACCEAARGRRHRSEECLERAADIAARRDDEVMHAREAAYRSIAQHLMGAARDSADSAESLLDATTSRWLADPDYHRLVAHLAWNLLLRGYAERAAAWLQRAEDRRVGPPTGRDFVVLQALAAIALGRMGRRDEATERLKRATEYGHHVARPEIELLVTGAEGICSYQQGLNGAALELLAHSNQPDDAPDPMYLDRRHFRVWEMYAHLAASLRSDDQPHDRSRDSEFLDAVRRLGRLRGDHEALQVHWLVGRTAELRLAGRLDAATQLSKEASHLARRTDNPWALAESRRQYALVLEARREDAAARRAIDDAYRIGGDVDSTRNGSPAGDGSTLSTSHSIGESSGTTESPDDARDEIYDRALLRVSQAASRSVDPDRQIRNVLDEIVSIFGAERGLVFLTDGEDAPLETLALEVARDARKNTLDPVEDYSQTVVDRVLRRREPVVVGASKVGVEVGSRSVVAENLRNIVAAPLTFEDRFVGVVYLDNRLAKGVFTHDDVQNLLAMAGHVPIVLENIRMATTDAVTHLPNRRHFLDAGRSLFRSAKRSSVPLTAVMFDLDHFSDINDEHGHLAGDRVLEGVGRCCRENLRDDDIVGRLGGEEFAMVLPRTEAATASEVADRLRRAIGARKVEWREESITVTMSAGVAELSDEDRSLEDLLHRADERLLEAKELGRNQIVTDSN